MPDGGSTQDPRTLARFDRLPRTLHALRVGTFHETWRQESLLTDPQQGNFDSPPATDRTAPPRGPRYRSRIGLGHPGPPARETPGRYSPSRMSFRNTNTQTLYDEIYVGSSDGTARPDLHRPPRPRAYPYPPTPAPPRMRRRRRSPDSDWHESTDDFLPPTPKRLRVDTEPYEDWRSPIKYGYYGQVEPGRLRLEIISCDGGEHKDPLHLSTSLGAQNLLKHDKSVYCSERPTSSIVFRHADDNPFCLEKLHIVGPEHGFTAPVREGIVYVAMSLNDLSKYMDPPPHARIRGVHTPPYRRHRRPSSERISLEQALLDSEVSAALGTDHSGPRISSRRMQSYGEIPRVSRSDPPESPCEPPTNQDVLETDEEHNLQFILIDNDEPGPEDSSPQDVIDFRNHRLRNFRRRVEGEEWYREARWSDVREADDRDNAWRHLDAMMARQRMTESPPPGHDDHHYENIGGERRHHTGEVREYYEDGLNDNDVTRARFHIRSGNYKVAIKFDPPVSGRFILLKLWANRSNVDVQSVIAKGYGEARFFPAIEPR